VPLSVFRSVLESMLGSKHQNLLGGVLGCVLRVCLVKSSELTWEYTDKQAGSMPSWAIGSVLQSVL